MSERHLNRQTLRSEPCIGKISKCGASCMYMHVWIASYILTRGPRAKSNYCLLKSQGTDYDHPLFDH